MGLIVAVKAKCVLIQISQFNYLIMSKKCYELCDGNCNRCKDTNICDAYKEYLLECKEYGPEEKITDEDIWYAMTDGMYGDYPGGDIDYDTLGFD
jgi:hypothetical protein